MEKQELRTRLIKVVRTNLKMNSNDNLDIVLENLINDAIADSKATEYALPLMSEYVVMTYKIWKTNQARIEQANQKETLDYWQGKVAQVMKQQ